MEKKTTQKSEKRVKGEGEWNKLVFYPNAKAPLFEVDENGREEVTPDKKTNIVPRMHTMRFRIWLAFVSMTAVVILIAWMMYFVFFDATTVVMYVFAGISIAVLAGGLVIAYFISAEAVKPLSKLSREVSQYDENGKIVPLEMSGLSDVDELRASFSHAIAEIESNNMFRRDLLANISHDMRTPLTMIQAYAEMMRDISAGNKEKTKANASTIIAETQRLNIMINEVMALSKLEAGVEPIQCIDFDYSEKVLEVIERFQGLSGVTGYEITADIDSGIVVNADHDNIDRVLYNLIGNAINYTGEDKSVHVVCEKKGSSVITRVCDTGKGIAKDEMSAVWDKYYRLTQDKRRVLGSGLGLSIVKTVLEKHGVEFGMSSAVGVGSKFFFYLPLVSK